MRKKVKAVRVGNSGWDEGQEYRVRKSLGGGGVIAQKVRNCGKVKVHRERNYCGGLKCTGLEVAQES